MLRPAVNIWGQASVRVNYRGRRKNGQHGNSLFRNLIQEQLKGRPADLMTLFYARLAGRTTILVLL